LQICSNKWQNSIATQNGLNLYQPEKDAFQVYKKIPGDPGSLSHNFILSVYENPDGTIWVGTNGYGLDRFDPGSGKFTNYSIANGLPNNTIYAIRESKGALWLSTNNGLTKLDLKSGVITVYNARN
jgi:ligand-binding sensor domain-containing protein